MAKKHKSSIKTKNEREQYFKTLKTPDSKIDDTYYPDIDKELTSYTEIDDTEVERDNVARTPLSTKFFDAVSNNAKLSTVLMILVPLFIWLLTIVFNNNKDVERIKSDLFFLRSSVEDMKDKYSNVDGRLTDNRVDIEILKIEIERDLSEIRGKIDNLLND